MEALPDLLQPSKLQYQASMNSNPPARRLRGEIFITTHLISILSEDTQKQKQKHKNHLWPLKQGKDETLKKYTDLFSEGMNLVDDFTDSDVPSSLREGLREGELLTFIVRRAPKTFGELLARAQEFVNVEEYLQSCKNHKGEGKYKTESEAIEGDSKKTKVENKTAKNNKKHPIAPRFQAFALLNAIPEQILMQIENRNILSRSEPILSLP